MPGIVPPHVLEDLALGGRVDARGEIVEQQHARVQRQRAGQHDALLLAARQAAAALGDDGVELVGQAVDEIGQLGGRDRLLEVRVGDGLAEGDVLAQRQVEDDAVLEDEPDLAVQRVRCRSRRWLGRRTRRAPECGSSRPGQQIEQLGLAGGGRADDGGPACRPRRRTRRPSAPPCRRSVTTTSRTAMSPRSSATERAARAAAPERRARSRCADTRRRPAP